MIEETEPGPEDCNVTPNDGDCMYCPKLRDCKREAHE